MEWLGFTLCAGGGVALATAYIFYPAGVYLAARMAGRSPAERDWSPSVTLIITAHNEERDIAAKLDNSLALDYPRELLQIIVSSDASLDATDEIVRRYQARGVRLVRTPQRGGKTLATQRAVREATGDVLVFSDATGMYGAQAVRRLVRALADPTVGCVSGRVEYRYAGTLLAHGFRIYQCFVKAMRRQESALGVLTSVSGSIHATRRDGFPNIDAHQNYDLLLPLEMAHRGLRNVYQSAAVSTEVSRARPREEFRARVRAGIRAFSYLAELRRRRWLAHRPLFLWAVASGKILRWFSPVWLLALLAGNALLAPRGGIWLWSLLPHAGFYALGAAAALLPSSRLTRWLAAPLFVTTVCAGFLVGLARFMRGGSAAAWESAR